MFGNPAKGASGKLADLAAAKIREMIACGELEPGELIAEIKLAAALGMSRTPIREAVSLLEFEGILRSFPGRGAMVAEMRPSDCMEINAIRIALEPLAAIASMNVVPKAAVEEIRTKWEYLLRTLDTGRGLSAEELAEEDGRLHALFAENCGSPRLKGILRIMQFQSKGYVIALWDKKAFAKETIEQHLDIILGMERFDGRQVRCALEKHLYANNRLIGGRQVTAGPRANTPMPAM